MNILQGIVTVAVALITSLLGPVAVEYVKGKFLKKSKDVVGEAISTNLLVDHQLDIILAELQCDRVCIAQFHNGGHFFPTGKSIKKYSIFYEKLNSYASSIKEIFQNIPVSLFPKMFAILHQDSEISIEDCSQNDIDCGLFEVKGKKYKTKSFYILAINDLNNNFIGTLSISYYKDIHKLNLEEWIFLRQKVGAIGGILTDYLDNNK